MKLVFFALFFFVAMGCSRGGERDSDYYGDDSTFFTPKDFYREKNQINKYFIIDRKNVDYLTPATILSLRDVSDVSKIPEYLGTLCKDYTWMDSKRFIYVFESSQYAQKYNLFISRTKRTRPNNVPLDKYVAFYNPDEWSITFFPLVREKEKKVYMDKGWCGK